MIKGKDIIKLLLPGVIAGLILGVLLTYLVGVNKENAIFNYIGGAMCCLVPTFLNCLIVLQGTAKKLKRKLSIWQTIKRTIPYLIIAALFGLFIVAVVIERILGFDTREITVFITAIYQTILGIMTSTIAAYLALTKYSKDVKYTKR